MSQTAGHPQLSPCTPCWSLLQTQLVTHLHTTDEVGAHAFLQPGGRGISPQKLHYLHEEMDYDCSCCPSTSTTKQPQGVRP